MEAPLRTAVELGLATILLLSAGSKLVSWPSWRRALAGYRLRWLDSDAVAWLVPPAECLLALGLVLDGRPLAAVAVGVLFTSFAFVLSIAALRGSREDCACLGVLLPAQIGPLAVARAAGFSLVSLGSLALPVDNIAPGDRVAITLGLGTIVALLSLRLGVRQDGSVQAHRAE